VREEELNGRLVVLSAGLERQATPRLGCCNRERMNPDPFTSVFEKSEISFQEC
jgi:hypothetical protein